MSRNHLCSLLFYLVSDTNKNKREDDLSPPDIVNAGCPSKEPNRVVTWVVPTFNHEAMQVVCDREWAQNNSNFVHRSLAQPKTENTSQGEHTSFNAPSTSRRSPPVYTNPEGMATRIHVNCGPDWKWDVITAAVDRGPHPTAQTQLIKGEAICYPSEIIY